MTYNWQQEDWPESRYDLSSLDDGFLAFAEKTGRVDGLLKGLPEDIQAEAVVEMMVEEAVKTSAIEGEYLSRKDIMSSIRRNLGFGGEMRRGGDKRAEGAAALMVDVRNTFAAPLSESKLFEWHRLIMAGGRGVRSGRWRIHAEPMQVVSGPIGNSSGRSNQSDGIAADVLGFYAEPVHMPLEGVGLCRRQGATI
jgi:Fic family protein